MLEVNKNRPEWDGDYDLYIGVKNDLSPFTVDLKALTRGLVVIGQSGCGKSFMLGRLVEEIVRKTTINSKLLIIDPNSDFICGLSLKDYSEIESIIEKQKYNSSNEKFEDLKKSEKVLYDWLSDTKFNNSGCRLFGFRDGQIKPNLSWCNLSEDDCLELLFGERFNPECKLSDIALDYIVKVIINENIKDKEKDNKNYINALCSLNSLKGRVGLGISLLFSELSIREKELDHERLDLIQGYEDLQESINEDVQPTYSSNNSLDRALSICKQWELSKKKEELQEKINYMIHNYLDFDFRIPKDELKDYYAKSSYIARLEYLIRIDECLESRIWREYEKIENLPYNEPDGINNKLFNSYFNRDNNRINILDESQFHKRIHSIIYTYYILKMIFRIHKHFRDEYLNSFIEDSEKKIDRRLRTFILIDEAHNFAPEDTNDPHEKMLGELIHTIAAEGRKYGLHLILATQRPNKVKRGLLGEFDNAIIMKMNSRRDLKLLAEEMRILNVDLLEPCLSFQGQGNAIAVGEMTRMAPYTQIFKSAPRRTKEGGVDIPFF